MSAPAHRSTTATASQIPQYQSAFRPVSVAIASGRPAVEYTIFKFKRTICIVDDAGTPSLAKLDKEEEIMIAKDWQKYKGSTEPKGGWLGGGSSKYAFEVCLYHLPSIRPTIAHLNVGIISEQVICHSADGAAGQL